MNQQVKYQGRWSFSLSKLL